MAAKGKMTADDVLGVAARDRYKLNNFRVPIENATVPWIVFFRNLELRWRVKNRSWWKMVCINLSCFFLGCGGENRRNVFWQFFFGFFFPLLTGWNNCNFWQLFFLETVWLKTWPINLLCEFAYVPLFTNSNQSTPIDLKTPLTCVFPEVPAVTDTTFQKDIPEYSTFLFDACPLGFDKIGFLGEKLVGDLGDPRMIQLYGILIWLYTCFQKYMNLEQSNINTSNSESYEIMVQWRH